MSLSSTTQQLTISVLERAVFYTQLYTHTPKFLVHSSSLSVSAIFFVFCSYIFCLLFRCFFPCLSSHHGTAPKTQHSTQEANTNHSLRKNYFFSSLVNLTTSKQRVCSLHHMGEWGLSLMSKANNGIDSMVLATF